MSETLQLTRTDQGVGVILPSHVLDALDVEAGDVIYLSRTKQGYQLTTLAPEYAEALEDAKTFMQTHKHTFEVLAR